MTPDDRATDLHAGQGPVAGKPLPPLAKGRKARHDAIVTRVNELNAGGMLILDAVTQALDELDPEPPTLPLASKMILFFTLLAISVVLVPLLGYAVGRGLVPLFEWGFGWIG